MAGVVDRGGDQDCRPPVVISIMVATMMREYGTKWQCGSFPRHTGRAVSELLHGFLSEHRLAPAWTITLKIVQEHHQRGDVLFAKVHGPDLVGPVQQGRENREAA
jgi:hypothetical protein